MSGYGSQPTIKTLLINNNAGADKTIGVAGSGPLGADPDLVIPHMVKRIEITVRALSSAWRLAFASGDIAAGFYKTLAATQPYTVHPATASLLYVRGDEASSPTLEVEYWT